jgi:glutamate-1-semialdehyde aminotransferase
MHDCAEPTAPPPPVGARLVCGRADLMQRFHNDRPADICLARGTFNSHPGVMGAMAEFLERMRRRRSVAPTPISTPSGTRAPKG